MSTGKMLNNLTNYNLQRAFINIIAFFKSMKSAFEKEQTKI